MEILMRIHRTTDYKPALRHLFMFVVLSFSLPERLFYDQNVRPLTIFLQFFSQQPIVVVAVRGSSPGRYPDESPCNGPL